MFSIVIPTYNNLEYLKLCLQSIKKNSKFDHEIIIHVNEGVDGTLDYLKTLDHKVTYTKENSGVCVAFNTAVHKSTKDYIVLAHDDMYFCPNWDEVFFKELQNIPKNSDFFLSGTMVQPFKSYINLDCGNNINNLLNSNFKSKDIFNFPSEKYKVNKNDAFIAWGGVEDLLCKDLCQ